MTTLYCRSLVTLNFLPARLAGGVSGSHQPRDAETSWSAQHDIPCISVCLQDKTIEPMNIEELREYCIQKPGVTEEFPFDETTLVFKVMGKMFALTNLDGDWSLSLKCDPDRAIGLREQFPAIQPGYHMSKVHWNTMMMDGSLSAKLILELIDHSYQLVVDKLPKNKKPHIQPFSEGEGS